MELTFLIIPKMISFLILLSTGYLVGKLGIIARESMPSFAGFLLKVVLPCLNIVLLTERKTDFFQLLSFSRIILWQVGTYLLMAAIGLLGAILSGQKDIRTANVHTGCCIGGNFAFVVLPLAMVLLDKDTQALIPVCAAVDTIVVWTLGLCLFTRGVKSRETWTSRLRHFMTPTLVSLLLALVLNSLGISIPDVIMALITYISDISYSLGFIYVGCSLCYMPRQSLVYVKPVGLVVVGKLLMAPLVIYFVSSAFLTKTESLLLMMIAGAPTMSTSCSICRQYGLNEDYAASAVFVTTLSCMCTIPLVFAVISLF